MDYSQFNGVPQPGYFSAYTFDELEILYSQSVAPIPTSGDVESSKGRQRKDGARRVSQGTVGVVSLDEYGNPLAVEPVKKRAKKEVDSSSVGVGSGVSGGVAASMVAMPVGKGRGKKRHDIAYIPFDFPHACAAFQGSPGAFSTNEQLKAWLEWVLPQWDAQREGSLRNQDHESLAVPVRNAMPRSARAKAAPEPVLKTAANEKNIHNLPQDLSLPDWWTPRYIGNPHPLNQIPRHWQGQVIRAWDVVTRQGHMWDIDMASDISLADISLSSFIDAFVSPHRSCLLDLIMSSLLRISARNTTLAKLKRKQQFEAEESTANQLPASKKKQATAKEETKEEDDGANTFEEAYAQNLTLGAPISPITWPVSMYTRIQQARVFLVQPLGVRAYTQNDDERMDGLVTWTPNGPVSDLMFDITALLKTNDFGLLPLERKLAALALVTRWALSGKYAKAAAEQALDCQDEVKARIVRLEAEAAANARSRESSKQEIAEYMNGLLDEALVLSETLDTEGLIAENVPPIANHNMPVLTGNESNDAVVQRYVSMYVAGATHTEALQLQMARLQYRATYMFNPLRALVLGKDRFQTTYYMLGGGVGTVVAHRGTFFPSFDPLSSHPQPAELDSVAVHANLSALMTGDTEDRPLSSHINVVSGQLPAPDQWTVFDDEGSLANLLRGLNARGRDECVLHDNLQETFRFAPLVEQLYKHGASSFNCCDLAIFEPAPSAVVDGLGVVATRNRPKPTPWREYVVEGEAEMYYDHMMYDNLSKDERKEWMTGQILHTGVRPSKELVLQGMKRYQQCISSSNDDNAIDLEKKRCKLCAEVVDGDCFHCRYCHRSFTDMSWVDYKEHVDSCNEKEQNTKQVFDDVGVMDLTKRVKEESGTVKAGEQDGAAMTDLQPSLETNIKEEDVKEEQMSDHMKENSASAGITATNTTTTTADLDEIDQTRSWGQVESSKELIEYERNSWSVQRQDVFKREENSIATNSLEVYMARSVLLDIFRGLPSDALNVMESTASEWHTQCKFACTFHGLAHAASELATFVKPSYLRPGFDRQIWETALKDTISFGDLLWRIVELDHTLMLSTSKRDRCAKCARREDATNAFVSCGGCNAIYHIYCSGLNSIPRNVWFCITCRKLKTLETRKEKERSLLKEQERVLRVEERKQLLSEQRAAANALRKQEEKKKKELKQQEEAERKARELLELAEPRKRQRNTATLYDGFDEDDEEEEEDEEDEEEDQENGDFAEDTEEEDTDDEAGLDDEDYRNTGRRGRNSGQSASRRKASSSRSRPASSPQANSKRKNFIVARSDNEGSDAEASPPPPPPKAPAKRAGRPPGRQTKHSSFEAENSESEEVAVIISSRGRVAKKRSYTEAVSDEEETEASSAEEVVPKKGKRRVIDDDDDE